MSNARKSTRRGRRDHGGHYLRSRAEVAQQFIEEKPKPVNPLAELYKIMAKMEMENEGACTIPALDPVKDQKEELAPKTSESEEKSKK